MSNQGSRAQGYTVSADIPPSGRGAADLSKEDTVLKESKPTKRGWYADEHDGAVRLWNRLGAYMRRRFIIIGLLWAGVGVVAVSAPSVATLFLPTSCVVDVDLKLPKYVDEKLLAVLSLGLIVSLSAVSLVERAILMSPVESTRLVRGRLHLWD